MKKILMALVMLGMANFSAEAQSKTAVACGAPEGKVCRKGGSCYKTKYAENYKVCKSDFGYFICCEEPNNTNTTFSKLPIVRNEQRPTQDQYYAMQSNERGTTMAQDELLNEQDATVPQSQSYPNYSANVATAYEGYYHTNHIKVCENTDNVAAANRAPYVGCPSPASEGPEKEKQRNVNVSNPSSSYPQPASTGNGGN